MSTISPAAPANAANARLLLSIKETCEVLGGISARSLWTMSNREHDPLPITRLGVGRGRVMYSVKQLEEWIARQK